MKEKNQKENDENISDRKIMIVDDNPDILISLRTVFEQFHFEVFTVDSGHDCIKELEYGFKGIVLMDIMMPFMDGWDTIREIIKRGLDKDLVISIITANGSSSPEKMKGLESYIHDYIPKPFNLQVLLSQIAQMKQ